MPNVTIYLDHELAERVRKADVPVSRVCQQALRVAVAEQEGEPWNQCEQCRGKILPPPEGDYT